MNAPQTLFPPASLPPQVQPAVQARIAFNKAPSGASYISGQQVGYPFHLGRPLKLPDDPAGMAAVYLQSCSGGIFSGEDLHVQLHAGPGSEAHVSTGAATVAHSMLEESARQTVSLSAQAGALLEYLPMATILFPRAKLISRVNVVLHPGARVMLCDAFCLHTPLGNSGVFDFYRAELEIRDPSGQLLAGDRLALTGQDMAHQKPGVSDHFQALATFMLVGQGLPVDALKAALRQGLSGLPDSYLGISALPNDCGVSVRIMTLDAVALRNGLHATWASLRKQLTGVAPRIRRK
ncbi:urease accessory protein UreD [Pseudomonas sp. W5-36]|uniref:urease accessory protein UreD n=1 Tax=Pseudomonas sp. W5-36 TaxID=3097455 RepID=UPI0039792563